VRDRVRGKHFLLAIITYRKCRLLTHVQQFVTHVFSARVGSGQQATRSWTLLPVCSARFSSSQCRRIAVSVIAMPSGGPGNGSRIT
jgi:hypothetical protein